MRGYASIDVGDITQWTAGVDWVTMTWADDDENGAYAMAKKVVQDAAHQVSLGSLGQEYAVVLGYKGVRIGRAFAGLLRGQGAMVTATGAAANWLVAESGLEPDNVSRLDVQVTVWGSGDIGHIPSQVAKKSAAARLGARGRPWKVRCEDGFGEGDTAYLGSRQSSVYCRCYDKGRESGEAVYKQALRYETEYKKEWASRAYAHLVGRHVGQFDCYDIVARTYATRGIELPPIRPLGTPIAVVPDDVADRTERRLNWYREQVAPSIAKLLTEGVSRGTILASLGLE